jgi:hypothetical protein
MKRHYAFLRFLPRTPEHVAEELRVMGEERFMYVVSHTIRADLDNDEISSDCRTVDA